MSMTTSQRKIAVFIDVANADGVDLQAILDHARRLGRLDDVRAYGDFRQRHLDEPAIEMYALGVRMIHCPSWPNGARREDGSARRKRSDDRLMEADIRELIHRRRSVNTYVIVSGDADILPTLHALREHGKEVRLMCPGGEQGVGRVLRMCDIAIEEAPLNPELPSRTHASPAGVSRNGGRRVAPTEAAQGNGNGEAKDR